MIKFTNPLDHDRTQRTTVLNTIKAIYTHVSRNASNAIELSVHVQPFAMTARLLTFFKVLRLQLGCVWNKKHLGHDLSMS